ncbi:hypothetical protein GQ53DRAFT_696175 [Thozetella sp. PMI_491]|nr:hypothetical protein GQ53DRAFT_696175 [Thozetella sp. PMI_491]
MSTGEMSTRGVRVAVEGCGHGKLQDIYASVERLCKERNWDSVDLLIIGGDFQAVRNAADLTVMSVPAKYCKLGDFHEYYSGSRAAPYLTIFIGGNHEASAYLWELYYGGWAAPNIYYLGAANVLRLGPLRIAGMSGIWKESDYRKPHMERLPFSWDDTRSVYHTREIDIRKLLQISTQVDIGISHDWPHAIENYGDRDQLFKMKPHFERGSRDGSLGSRAAEYVMDRLRPQYWFSAHMHCKFLAVKTYKVRQNRVVQRTECPASSQEMVRDKGKGHKTGIKDSQKDAKALDIGAENHGKETDMAEDLWADLPPSVARPPPQPRIRPGQPVPDTITNTMVRFLALDKCNPGQDFLQLLEIYPPRDKVPGYAPEQSTSQEAILPTRLKLQYDPEWLAITRVFSQFLSVGDSTAQTPPDMGWSHYLPLIEAERKWVDKNIVQSGKLDIPENFSITAPIHVVGQPESTTMQPDEHTNPQTEAFCALVGVDNLWAASEEERLERKARGPSGVGGRRGGPGYSVNKSEQRKVEQDPSV